MTQLYKNTDLRKGNQSNKKVNDKTDYKECHPMKLRLSKTPINLNIKLINFLDKTDRKMYSINKQKGYLISSWSILEYNGEGLDQFLESPYD